MKFKFQPGQRVKYTNKHLKYMGAWKGMHKSSPLTELLHRRGEVIECKYVGRRVVVTVQWDGLDEIRYVASGNLQLAKD